MRVLLFLIMLVPTYVGAGWSLLRGFGQPVSCGYFFDAREGFVGTGNFFNEGQPHIWHTEDGGSTWTLALTPQVDFGRLTSIFMYSHRVGYATVVETSFITKQSIWKTTDGGLTWFDHTQRGDFTPTCVYATSKSLIVASWTRFGGGSGATSTNDGATYGNFFTSTNMGETNGIDFVDDLTGVVTPGPYLDQFNINTNYPKPCFYTTDGGISWKQGGSISESWGIYALKGTQTFFALPEGNQSDAQTDVVRSTDHGQTWATIHSFPWTYEASGHIAGKGNTLYVQSADGQGLFRSDDLGSTWKNVKGPSNYRDTRFVVTGCQGEVVYAFDTVGNVWKTTDGGDGTLQSGGNIDFTLSFDPLTLITICTPVRGWLPLWFDGCGGNVIIDALTIVDDPNAEFSVDTLSVNLLGNIGEDLSVPILYTPKTPGPSAAHLRVRAHTSVRSVDTLIDIAGKIVRLPSPYIQDIARAKAGDTVIVPIFLDQTADPFAINEYDLSLSFNTDLLEPIGFDSIQTLTRMIQSHSFEPSPEGLKLHFKLAKPIVESNDLSMPLLKIIAKVYLTSEPSTTITIDSFNVHSGLATASLLGCNPQTSIFTINLLCGDSTLLEFMKTGEFSIANLRPNPSHGEEIIAEITSHQPAEGTLELINLFGNVVCKTSSYFREGNNSVKLPVSHLSSGIYYVRLRTPQGGIISKPVIIAR